MTATLEPIPGFFFRSNNCDPDRGAFEEAYLADGYNIRKLTDVNVALDIGAHIGSATRLLHECFPNATIIAVEANYDNIEQLRKNVGDFAHVVHAALTYELGDLYVASTVYPNCRTTGSSIVVSQEQWDKREVEWTWDPDDYHLDGRMIPTVTIEHLMTTYSLPSIDFVKMDCEGSEINILDNCTCLDKIGMIVGEYHNFAKLQKVKCFDQLTLRGRMFRK